MINFDLLALHLLSEMGVVESIAKNHPEDAKIILTVLTSIAGALPTAILVGALLGWVFLRVSGQAVVLAFCSIPFIWMSVSTLGVLWHEEWYVFAQLGFPIVTEVFALYLAIIFCTCFSNFALRSVRSKRSPDAA